MTRTVLALLGSLLFLSLAAVVPSASAASLAPAASAECSNPQGWDCCGRAFVQVNCTPCDGCYNHFCDIYVNGFCCDVTRNDCPIFLTEGDVLVQAPSERLLGVQGTSLARAS